jgi:3'-5' exonuclease
MVAAGTLPQQLKVLLSHPQILKAGRLVDADLGYLQSACKGSSQFVGGLDLAKYAKDRRVVNNAQCSLADLCARVLGKRLNKNVSERLSNAWEDDVLSSEQLQYAARDASASLTIYHKLQILDVPQPLPAGSLTSPTPVLLYSADNTTVIAQGQIAVNHILRPSYDTINITPTRTVIDVLEVLVPGAVVTTHRKQALSTFGPAPFSVVCLRSHLRSFNPAQLPLAPKPPQSLSLQDGQSTSESRFGRNIDDSAEAVLEDLVTENDGIPIGGLLLNDLADPPKDLPHIIDGASAALGMKLIGTIPKAPETWDNQIRSRVLKDPFHVFNMFYISRRHGLRYQFVRELRDAIFIPDQQDKARIDAWGATQNPRLSYEKLRNISPEWVRKRCKHIIPPPKILYAYVGKVFLTYGPLKDPRSQAPLFNADNWQTAKQIMSLIENGYLSDPPDIPLYTVIGLDNKSGGLPIYKCARGTNSTEGAVHTHLRKYMPKSGVSLRHLHACLHDYVLRHNLTVS